ncbi:MAG: hypothetical protein ACE5GX_09335 [Thermoanaerobaculia bacterium]
MRVKPLASSTRLQPRLRVFDLTVSSPQLEFVVLDFSPCGLRIESRDSIEVGKTYSFDLERHGTVTRIPGDARWCRVDRNLEIGPGEFQTIYRAGFALQDRAPIAVLPESYAGAIRPRAGI